MSWGHCPSSLCWLSTCGGRGHLLLWGLVKAPPTGSRRPPEGMFCVAAQTLEVATTLLGKDPRGHIWMLFLRLLFIGFVTLSKSMSLGISFPICKMGIMTSACLPPGMMWLNDSESSSTLQSCVYIWEVINIFSRFQSRPSLRRNDAMFLNMERIPKLCPPPLQYFCLGLSKMVIFSQAWNYEPALLVKGHNNLSSYFINSFLHSDILIGPGIINHKHVPQDCIVNVKLDRKL